MDETKKSMSQIIPEETQQELMAIGDDLSRSFWRVGDITNSLLAVYENSDLGKSMIYSAVGLFVGKAGRTIREYAMVARRFDDAWRMEYDMLTFDHFRIAMRMGDDCEKVLEWAVTEGADTRPATVDAILAKFAINEVEDNFIVNIRTKADALVSCMNPLLETPLKEKTQFLKAAILDFIEDCELQVNKVV